MIKKGFKFYCGMFAAAAAITAAITAVMIWWEKARDVFVDGVDRVLNLFVHQYDSNEED